MSKRIDRSGLLLLIVASAIAGVLYLVLNNSFGGPQVRLSSPYQVTASFDDPQGLLKKSFVLARGVEVGAVERIEVEGDVARVTFGVSDEYAPIYRDATVRTGNRTLIGEPYIELDPGTPDAGKLENGAGLPEKQVLPNIEFDEALEALDKPTIDDLRSINKTFARGFRGDDAAAETSSVWASTGRVTNELRGLVETLDGQERNIRGVVEDSGTVLKELGDRERAVRSIVSNGERTLAALASRQDGLEAAIAEAPRLLSSARAALDEAEPLLVEARPLISDLRTAAPELSPTLEDLRPVARDARRVVAGLPRLNDAGVPALRLALPVVRGARPVARRLLPTLANLVPLLRYVEPRKNDVSALVSNLGEFANDGDKRGIWFRYNTFEHPGPSDGNPNLEGVTYEENPYPRPNENFDPRGLDEYPRLRPLTPGQ